MEIAIEDIMEMVEFRKKVNSTNITKITFTENGKAIDIEQQQLEDWNLTGLNVVDFIALGFYKTGWTFDEYCNA